MIYREAGQYKMSYEADMAVFPLREDRIGLAVIVAAAYGLAFVGNSFLLQAVMIPFLIFSLAAICLNILTGYTGLLSLGTGAFMGVGAYACYKLMTAFPDVNVIVWILASGLFSAAAGAIVGGLIIGIGEKLGEFYWGPLLGSGIESWLAYVIALLFLLYRPQGLFGERIIERI